MKITAVTPFVLGTQWRNLVYVKVETDEGLVGVGESRPINKVDSLVGYLNDVTDRFVLGIDPFDIERLMRRLTIEDYGKPGEIAMTGLAVIEMACWDIIGKALGQPVYRLLGGAVRDKIKAYANGWYTVERTPEEFHAAAQRAVAKGYRALKFDPFGAGYYEMERAEKVKTIGLVEAVRDAVGPDVEILIEMHGRFNPVTAVEMSMELAPFKPSWVEEPVPPANMLALQEGDRRRTPAGRARGDRRAAAHHARVPRAVRTARRRHHPARHRPLWRHSEHQEAGGVGRHLLRADRARTTSAGRWRPRPRCTWPPARPTSRSRSTSTTSTSPTCWTRRRACPRSWTATSPCPRVRAWAW